ncbi:MAG: DUF4493 domain-containing protein [Bacteroidales bacterium]
MKTRSLLLLLCCILITASCQKEEDGGKNGSMNLRLETNSEVIETRAARLVEESVPDVSEFALELYKGEHLINSWKNLKDFPADQFYPIGNYSIKAFHGSNVEEGFDKPAFEGSQNFIIEDGKVTDVQVICYLANVKISTEYSESFKSYFRDYTTSVVSGVGTPVIFKKDETRTAYMKPGALKITMALETSTGITSTLNVLDLSKTMPRTHYKLRFDVEAGSSTLLVSFDSATEEEPIQVDISDETLTATPPVFKTTGFESGQIVEQVEGMAPETDALSAILYAPARIASLLLTTQSECLSAKNWPASVDLAKADVATLSALEAEGLLVKGVGASVNMEHFAMIDFKNLIENLYALNGSSSHRFALVATDKNGNRSEELVLNVNSLDNRFDLLSVDSVELGNSEVMVSLQLKGYPENVTFSYVGDFGTWQEVSETEVISSEGDLHRIKISDIPMKNFNREMIARYGGKQSEKKEIKVLQPAVSMQVNEGDVWGAKAQLKLLCENPSNLEAVQKYSKVYLKKEGESTWNAHRQFTIADGVITLTALEGNTPYQVRISCLEKPQESEYSELVSFRTEAQTQLPNAGMENWFSNKTDVNDKPITSNLNLVYWNKFFPWSDSDESTQGWNTMNQKTTSDGKAPSKFLGLPTAPYVGCCYVANSGTIPTEDSQFGRAALIRSVGWGSGSTATGDNSTVKKTDAGQLYLGSYDKENQAPIYGIPFQSRPSGVSFYYKYIPKNPDDRFIAEMVVLDEDDHVLAQYQIPAAECGAVSAYTEKRIELDYNGEFAQHKAAKMYIRFVSGTQLDVNTTNFDLPAFGNLSDAETVGSKLFIDEITLLY